MKLNLENRHTNSGKKTAINNSLIWPKKNDMRILLTLLTFICYQATFGQFAIISDKDGFANVRQSPNISNNIIDSLANKEVVFCFEAEGEWLPIDYGFGEQNKMGYVHKSRVKFIKDFTNVPYDTLTDTLVTFKNREGTLKVTTVPFVPDKNSLEYHNENTPKNKTSYLVKINGKKIWGTDGNMPKRQYGQVKLQLGNNTFFLPIDNLYEPNLSSTKVNIDQKNRTLYISAFNSDGAGGYAVLWIVDNSEYNKRIVTMPF